MTVNIFSALVIDDYDCNDRVHTFLISSRMDPPALAIESAVGNSLRVRQGSPRIDEAGAAICRIRIVGDDGDDLEDRLSGLRAVIPGFLDADTVDATVGLRGRSHMATLRILRSKRFETPVDVLRISANQAIVDLNLTCDPWLRSASQTIAGNRLAAVTLGSTWPSTCDWTNATYAGKTPVVLRFDDGLVGDWDLFELLEARGLKGTFAIISGRVGDTGYLSEAQLRKMESCGHEIGGHSRSHTADPTTFAAFRSETGGCKEDLEAMGLTITGFYPPGYWVGAYYIHDPATWYGSAADLYLRSQYDYYSGYITTTGGVTTGGYRLLPVSGDARYGLTHYSPDDADFPAIAQTGSIIDNAYTTGRGLVLTFHVQQILAGQPTLAHFTDLADFLQTRIGEGTHVSLTATQLHYASAS